MSLPWALGEPKVRAGSISRAGLEIEPGNRFLILSHRIQLHLSRPLSCRGDLIDVSKLVEEIIPVF